MLSPMTKLFVGMIISSAILVTVVFLMIDMTSIRIYVLQQMQLPPLLWWAGAGIPYITNPITGGVLHLDTLRLTFSFFGPHSILVWADLLAFTWILWTMISSLVGGR